MKPIRVAISAAALSALAGCASWHTYAPEAGETMTKVQFLGFGEPKIWIDGKSFDLDFKDNNGKRYILVPANKRVTIRVPQLYLWHGINSTCNVALSLIAVPGQDLAISTGIKGNGCTMEAARIDNSKPGGVALEPSVAAPVNFRR